MIATLTKSQRREVDQIMASEDGALSLVEFVAQCAAMDRDASMAGLLSYRPDLAIDKVAAYVECSLMTCSLYNWVDRGLARRFSLENTDELQAFISMHSRLARALNGNVKGPEYADSEYPNVWDVFKGLAIRDVSAAKSFAMSATFPLPARSYFHTLYNGVFSVLRGDLSTLESLRPRLDPKSAPNWIRAMLRSLVGILDNDPDIVRDSITEVVRGYRRTDQVSDIRKTICFEAHGLYSLCKLVDPLLVQDLNPAAKLPWDTALSDALSRNDEPFTLDADLRFVSQGFHDVIVELQTPTWWDCEPQIGNAPP